MTDTNHTNARILEIRPDRVRESLDRGNVPVVGGAQGVSTDRDVTFLGRNGSDVTAVALAHALKADACELYTDVSGVFTADPADGAERASGCARSASTRCWRCARAGCPKPAMRGAEFARNWRVPLHVRSSFTWEPGTWVVEEDPSMEQAIVSAVVHDSSEAKVTLAGVPDKPGIAARVFRALADADVNVDMIVQNVSDHGVTDISFTVPHDDLDDAHAHHRRAGRRDRRDRVSRPTPTSRKVSLVGAGMKSNPGVAAKMFETLADAGVNIEMISTSAIRISCVVAEPDIERAAQVLHAAFELDIPA